MIALASLPWLKIIQYGVPAMLCFTLGFGAAWKIQGHRLDTCKTEKAAIQQSFDDCQNANAANAATIETMKNEIAVTNETCEKRLKSKSATISAIQKIDSLKGGTDATDSTDAVLDALNGLR